MRPTVEEIVAKYMETHGEEPAADDLEPESADEEEASGGEEEASDADDAGAEE